jgi:MinD-like ATPase involved in chromosome partitioning or flagellar assembly
MTGELHCISFHSVKGGVGKSTLSTLVAHGLACRHRETPVVLIDMDLTGTSLSDVLPLQAPSWSSGRVDLFAPPSDFDSCEVTRDRIEARRSALDDDIHVPYLNDFLLHSDPDWSTERDVLPQALSWRMAGGPDNLVVIPSSALPEDLRRIVPVIFDEEHAAFLEARIEALLDMLVPAQGRRIVVFDTPPTIPGLSRSILSLGFRLGGSTKQPLAEDGYIPERLRAAPVGWRIGMVVSRDIQDLRAAERWMELMDQDESALVRLVINRVPQGDEVQLQHDLFGVQSGAAESGRVVALVPTLANFPRQLVPEHATLQLFHRTQLTANELDGLLELPEWEP